MDKNVYLDGIIEETTARLPKGWQWVKLVFAVVGEKEVANLLIFIAPPEINKEVIKSISEAVMPKYKWLREQDKTNGNVWHGMTMLIQKGDNRIQMVYRSDPVPDRESLIKFAGIDRKNRAGV